MKKIFFFAFLVNMCLIQAQDTNILLLHASYEKLINPSLQNNNHEKIAPKINKPAAQETEKQLIIDGFEEYIKRLIPNRFDDMDHIWGLAQEEIQNLSTQPSIEDKDNLIIIKFSLPNNFSMDNAILDLIDNKYFTINLNNDDLKIIISGLIADQIICIAVYSETKQINTKGDMRTCSHESSMTHPFIGYIHDLEQNIAASYHADTHDIIITLHKDTPKNIPLN